MLIDTFKKKKKKEQTAVVMLKTNQTSALAFQKVDKHSSSLQRSVLAYILHIVRMLQ